MSMSEGSGASANPTLENAVKRYFRHCERLTELLVQLEDLTRRIAFEEGAKSPRDVNIDKQPATMPPIPATLVPAFHHLAYMVEQKANTLEVLIGNLRHSIGERD